MKPDDLIFLQEVLAIQISIVATDEHGTRRIQKFREFSLQLIRFQTIDVEIVTIEVCIELVENLDWQRKCHVIVVMSNTYNMNAGE